MDRVGTVLKMQDYIRKHFKEEDFRIEDICHHIGYSRRHAERMFKEMTGKTLQEYVNAVCLSQSARQLSDTDESILEIALKSHFQSHEGFTRSFGRKFHIAPASYRRNPVPIPLFVQYPVSHYEALCRYKEEDRMKNELSMCMVTAVERPARKLIYLPSENAGDYLSYCEEKGCEWEGLLNSINEKFDAAALAELPPFLTEEGKSNLAAGVEVPLEYDKPLPQGYRVADLEACVMLYFQGEPYEDENDFCKAIEEVYAAVQKYQPERYGYTFAYDKAPSYNFGADTETGAKIAVPAVKK